MALTYKPGTEKKEFAKQVIDEVDRTNDAVTVTVHKSQFTITPAETTPPASLANHRVEWVSQVIANKHYS